MGSQLTTSERVCRIDTVLIVALDNAESIQELERVKLLSSKLIQIIIGENSFNRTREHGQGRARTRTRARTFLRFLMVEILLDKMVT